MTLSATPRFRHRSLVLLSLFLLVGALTVFANSADANITGSNHVHIYVVGDGRSCNSPGEHPTFPTGTTVEVGLCAQNALGMGQSGQTVSWEVSGATIQGTPDGTTAGAAGEARISVKRTTAGGGLVKGTWVAQNLSASVSITWGAVAPPTDHIHLLTALGIVPGGDPCHTIDDGDGDAEAASTDNKDVEENQNLIACVHEDDHTPVEGRTVFLDTRNLGSATAPSVLSGESDEDGQVSFDYDSDRAGKTVSRAKADGKTSANSMTITWIRDTNHVHLFVQGHGSCHSHDDPATVPVNQEATVVACVHGVDHDGIPDSRSDPSTGTGAPREISWSKGGTGVMTVTTEGSRADANGQGFVTVESDDQGSATVIGSQSGESDEVEIDFACRTLDLNFFAYAANFTGGVYVATGDVNGDGCDDIITGAGAGGGPHVQVFNANGGRLAQGFAYARNFTGGVRVGAGDVDGDGRDEIITGPGPTGGPHVKVFDVSGGGLSLRNEFMAYNQAFTGGIFVAGGDLTGPNDRAEIITGPDQGGGPHVRIFSTGGTVLAETFVYNAAFTGGVRVGTVEVDGGSRVEALTGAGPGGGPHVRTFDIVGASFSPKASFFAFAPGFTGGIFVGGGEAVSSSSREEIAAGADAGGGPHVKLFNGSGGSVLSSFFAYNSAFTGGVRVAIGDGDSDGNGEIVTAPGAGGGPHIRQFE